METIEELLEANFDIKLQKLPKVDVHTGEKNMKFCWEINGKGLIHQKNVLKIC